MRRILRFAGHVLVAAGLILSLAEPLRGSCANEQAAQAQTGHAGHDVPGPNGATPCNHQSEDGCGVPCLPATSCASGSVNAAVVVSTGVATPGTRSSAPSAFSRLRDVWRDVAPDAPPPRA